uniref:Pre-rRNA-processing protein TSR2 homolog n=1 Tax=Graphocephala atropunctata TaxID=36148 RepID=A0A1B6LU08_9HEMI
MDQQNQDEYIAFANVVGIIFNNWTALKLAVEHGMGGPPAITQRKIKHLIDVATRLIFSGPPDEDLLGGVLHTMMDCEFSTVLEDDSSFEVAVHLYQLYQLFAIGDAENLDAALSSLPCTSSIWRDIPDDQLRPRQRPLTSQESSSSEDEENSPCEKPWNLVKRRK